MFTGGPISHLRQTNGSQINRWRQCKMSYVIDPFKELVDLRRVYSATIKQN